MTKGRAIVAIVIALAVGAVGGWFASAALSVGRDRLTTIKWTEGRSVWLIRVDTRTGETSRASTRAIGGMRWIAIP